MTLLYALLRIRDVYPGSEFFPSRIRIKEFKCFNPKKWFLSSQKYILYGLFIPDPDPDFLPIPDPGAKTAPDPGSGSATLLICILILSLMQDVAVVGVPDLTWGQKVGAVIVPVAGAQVQLNTLRYLSNHSRDETG
jgi:hypothetical protein